ncbi:tyrosine-type recombinase/integrase [Ureibacillus sp. 179-F W5.1 NHS]|nr:site-specific integrase [Lysinibacillus halotolerans]
MASVKPRKNKKGKITSWGISVSNYPEKPIRQGGFRTRQEAEAAAKYIEAQLKPLKKLRKQISSKYTLLPFHIEFEQWYIKKKSGLDPSTIDDYKNVKNKIYEFFDDELLINITQDMYQDFMEAQQKNTKATNVKLNKKIRAFAKNAFENNKITINFTTDVVIKGKDSSKKIKFIKGSDYKKLLSHLNTVDTLFIEIRLMLILAATTGIRYGELCGIRWEDIDFENKTLHIHQQWDYKKGTGFKGLKDPTLNQSEDQDIKERTIPLSEQTISILKEFHASDCFVPNNNNRLFYKADCKAKVLSNNSFNSNLKNILNTLNIPAITAHGLRHSYATYLASTGTDRTHLQYLMGHEDYKTTDEYYIHLHKDMFDGNAAQIQEDIDRLFV